MIYTMRMRTCRPFMKWAGGKTQLLPELLRRVPKDYGCYFEPFLGGGALFFALQPERAVLSDTNAELVNAFAVVRDELDPLLEELLRHPYEKEHYYEVRNADRTEAYARWSTVQRAGRLVYLNKTCFNGLYRVNSKGQFNVPFGRYENPTICDRANLVACNHVLHNTELYAEAFTGVEHRAEPGDFVYFDPPYLPLTRTANFTHYHAGGFSEDDQHALRELCDRLTAKGVHLMLSSSFTELALELYRNYHIAVVTATRAINAKPSKRGRVNELIVTNYDTGIPNE